MNSEILNLLQGLSDPGDLAGGICSFFKKHTSRLRQILTNIVDNMPADPDDTGTNFDIGSGIITILNDGRVAKSVDLDELETVLKSVINDADVISNVDVQVLDVSDGTISHEWMTYTQVLEMLKEQSDVSDALITTLTSFQDWMNNPDLNFEQLTLDRIQNLLPKESVVSEKLSQGISSIATRFSDSIREYAPSVLQNIMSLFGVNSSDYSDQQVGTYSGINAWTVVLGDIVDGVSTAFSQVPTIVGRLFATIGYAIAYAIYYVGNGIASAVEGAILDLAGATNAFKATNTRGDKTVSSCDWKYVIDSQYYNVGSTSFQELVDKLYTFWDNHNYHELSIPLFAGALNIQQVNSNATAFNLKLKPLNVTNINVAWNKTMGNSHLFYNLVQDNAGLINRNSNSDDYPLDLSRNDLANFFKELATNPDMYYLKDWKTDADAFMSCQCSKIICFMQLLLMMDTVPTPPGFLGTLLNCSDLADFYIEGERNYNSGLSALEPSNLNMLHYLTSMKKFTTAFNNNSGTSNEYIADDNTSISNLDTLWRFLTTLIDVVDDLEVLDDDALSCFLPYQTNIVYKKSSFYIPTDTENVNDVKGILKTGLTVAAVAAVVITGLAIRGAVKRKAFEMNAKAGSLSWNAAEAGDRVRLKAAYKLQKRANILDAVVHGSFSGSSGSVSALLQNNTSSDVTLVDIKKLIV